MYAVEVHVRSGIYHFPPFPKHHTAFGDLKRKAARVLKGHAAKGGHSMLEGKWVEIIRGKTLNKVENRCIADPECMDGIFAGAPILDVLPDGDC